MALAATYVCANEEHVAYGLWPFALEKSRQTGGKKVRVRARELALAVWRATLRHSLRGTYIKGERERSERSSIDRTEKGPKSE